MMSAPIRSASFALALLAAGPASALSCSGTTTIEGMYNFASASPEDYAIAWGDLTLTGPSNPPGGAQPVDGDINEMVGYVQPAQFSGEFFGGTDFNLSQSVPVMINVTCVAVWCGAASDFTNSMFFFRVENGVYILDAGACGTDVFTQAHPGMAYQVSVCHNEGC